MKFIFRASSLAVVVLVMLSMGRAGMQEIRHMLHIELNSSMLAPIQVECANAECSAGISELVRCLTTNFL